MTSADKSGVEPSDSKRTQRPASQRDVAASMALILDAMKNPIDPAYAEAAKRREQQGGPAKPSRTPLLVISITLIGILIGGAAAALRVPAKVAHDQRQGIISQINDTQTHNDQRSDRITQIRGEIAASQHNALGRKNQKAVQKQLASAQQQAGVASVSGPGMQLVLDNPSVGDSSGADSDPRTGGDDVAITSTDMQQIVNGLYEAGATGIAINGQRITSLSAIRFAGSAILVNYRPLATPYTVTALGPSAMSAAFERGDGGAYVNAMRKSGFSAKSERKSSLTLPAVSSIRLSYATPVE